MKKFVQQLCAAGLMLTAANTWAGFSIQNGQLIDANGNPFIMRGVNHPHTWFRGNTQQALIDIADTGANSVRIVLATGGQWARNDGADVANVIAQCKSLALICVLEVHDATGWGEQSSAVHISTTVDYWTSPDILNTIQGQEDYILVNIANEPFGNNVPASSYVDDTAAVIRALRNAGLTHTLVVDAANWGQDWQGIMRDNAQTLVAADTLGNLLFSVHMYEVYQDRSTIANYMQAFEDMNLPLVVGEFGGDHNGQPVDEDSILAEAEARGVGYLGWSWSGNGGCCANLDMVINWNPNNLSSWGNRLINGTNGIAQTSQCASVFPGCEGTDSSFSSSSSSSSSSTLTFVTRPQNPKE